MTPFFAAMDWVVQRRRDGTCRIWRRLRRSCGDGAPAPSKRGRSLQLANPSSVGNRRSPLGAMSSFPQEDFGLGIISNLSWSDLLYSPIVKTIRVAPSKLYAPFCEPITREQLYNPRVHRNAKTSRR